MGTVIGLTARRPTTSSPEERAGIAAAPGVPKGCKGPACPAFALCGGRCALPLARKAALEVLAPVAR